MSMKVTQTSIPGVLVIEPQVFTDDRGFFLETYNAQRYADAGLDVIFRQDNHSRSKKGVLRGLHYQLNHPQGKLVSAVTGEIFDVAVDIRKGSPTFGKWAGAVLSAENHKQFYIPPGFAHGFCVLSDFANVTYKCTEIFHPGDDYGILWSDETVAIDWPSRENLIISEKDRNNPSLKDLPENLLPHYQS